MNYELRLATLDDCSTLSKFKREVWETTYRGIYPDDKLDNYDYEINTNKFKKIIENEDIKLYVVLFNKKIIGYFDYGKLLRPYTNFNQDIWLLYLLKDYQSLCIGKEIFLFASRKIKENGYNEFFVSCNKYNYGAQKFYEKMGGEIIEIDEDNSDKSIPQIRYNFNIK